MSEQIFNPKISVLMPCYNHEKYVAQSIESVLSQTYKNIEFIVLDNGSTDNSYEVIKRYSDRIDKILHVDRNDLILHTHLWLENATGDYIAFMTSDDLWEADKLEKQVEAFKNHPDAKACFTWIRTVDEDLNIVQDVEENVFYQHNRSRYEWLEQMILEDDCFACPSAVLDYDVWTEICHRKEWFYQISDMHMWLQLLLKWEVYVVEEPLTCFRWHLKPGQENISAPTKSRMARTSNEKATSLRMIIERMEDDIFCKAFGKYFRNKTVAEHAEIVCEKLFFLMMLAEKKPYMQQVMVDFFYGHLSEMVEILLEKYNFSFLDFQDYCADKGIGYLAMEKQRYERESNLLHVQYGALQAALDVELPSEERKRIYRYNVGKRVNDNVRDLIHVTLKYMEGIFSYIENSNDEQLQNDFAYLREGICMGRQALRILWEEMLCFDMEIDVEAWKEVLTLLGKQEFGMEDVSEKILPCFITGYEIIRQYV